MSGKRFCVVNRYGVAKMVYDNQEDMLLGVNDAVHLLNKLAEENEQLQGKIKRVNAFIVSKDLVIEYLKWNKER